MHQLARNVLIGAEVALLSALILATRCANYEDVFVGGNVYFTDADCYARMTRVRMVAEHPGLILRHHDFENYPIGTTPHTTVPFDYLILGFSVLLKPFTIQAVDMAGALISPLLALLGGWFLWWWSLKFRYRWILLILYAISPILVHGTELGRPDHQSLSILLVMVAICAELILIQRDGTPAIRQWSIVTGITWALAIWVSAYEPLILFLLVLTCRAVAWRRRVLIPKDTASIFDKHRRIGWILFAATLAIALLIERRIPSFSIFSSGAIFENWARTIGELAHVSPANPIWLRWTGYFLFATPLLIWFGFRTRKSGGDGCRAFLLVTALLVATYSLTIWQARWGYFFGLIFALTLPALLEPFKSRTAVWIAFALSLLPVLKEWDDRLWPNDAELARRAEQRHESVQVRDLAISIRSTEVRPFLAPWWLSPSIAYWSGQPGVAGSSHEGLSGIEASARFFQSTDWGKAQEILEKRQVQWVVAYDSERVKQNSAALLGSIPTGHELCSVLNRTPTKVPRFLIFSAQNGVAKLYRVANNL